MSNKPSATIPSLYTEPNVLDRAVPDPKAAWDRFDRLVGKVLDAPKESTKAIDKSRQTLTSRPK